VPALPALDPSLLLPRLAPARAPSFPFDAETRRSARLFYLARAGVHAAVRHFLGRRAGTVLMPAYHHGVEVEAVRAAGARVAFYRVYGDMQIDLEDLERRLAGDVDIVYITHFAGFAQPIAEVARRARARGVPLIEDCALALLSRDSEGRALGTFGDAAVFCLYKSLPVPHGGLLFAPRERIGAPAVSPPPLASTLHHAAGLALAHYELRGGAGALARSLLRALAHGTVDRVVDHVHTGTQHLEPRELVLGASRLVERLLDAIDFEMVVVRRRRNFRRLAEALDGAARVIGAPLAPGCCPLFVPVRVRDKPRALEALRARGIEAVDFWSGGDPAADACAFPDAARLRREVLELPCHQSLDDDAIDFVARAAREVLRTC
jgi:dTDP-4-amino-4,6-dideoxygalactose transaminase